MANLGQRAFSLVHLLWQQIGQGRKPKPAFANEKEALEFCERVYKETGGVTPELRRAYMFYLQNAHDDCPPSPGHRPF
jgi:hypothetical protein